MVMMVMKQDARLSVDVFFLGRRLAPGLFVTNKTKLTFQKRLSHYEADLTGGEEAKREEVSHALQTLSPGIVAGCLFGRSGAHGGGENVAVRHVSRSRNWLFHPLFRERWNSADSFGILKAEKSCLKELGEASPAAGETSKQKIKIGRTKVRLWFLLKSHKSSR